MSLEAKLELLTAAVIELTAAIGGMQAPGPVEVKVYPNGPADGQTGKSAKASAATVKGSSSACADGEKSTTGEVPNDQPSSSDTTSGEPSAPTGESSSPALDYVKDVKPITIQLSKEKGREITIGVLSRFGVKSAQDLYPAQWAEYIAHCKSVLAGGEV
jgi:hypothetical protein